MNNYHAALNEEKYRMEQRERKKAIIRTNMQEYTEMVEKKDQARRQRETPRQGVVVQSEPDIFKNPNFGRVPLGYWRNINVENPINHEVNKFCDFSRDESVTYREDFRGSSPYVKRLEKGNTPKMQMDFQQAAIEQNSSDRDKYFWVKP